MKKIKNILITSGGTKVKIDMVRNITNMSKGTFGSRIAEVFYDRMNDINLYFLGAVNSQKPVLTKINKSFMVRELIGKNLGQFHNDFDEVADGYAYQSIFDGKKCMLIFLRMIKEKQEFIIE